eukprot:CAMPEP_0172921168 /NCGR_PEP_ID=MMETSP1075-20121228/205389_1 /TAXON_ID=2916 /ORGANISM="Ceratium fusus, Strain PA161109" /LENGTH=63 /DNA_ID=CAMNT_0013781289 /DNA_START=18 /DNA_END=206 /DNA_ORIENTATION=-
MGCGASVQQAQTAGKGIGKGKQGGASSQQHPHAVQQCDSTGSSRGSTVSGQASGKGKAAGKDS